jgi:hypothetical protein
MNKLYYILFIIIFYILLYKTDDTIEKFTNYKQCSSIPVSKRLEDIFKEHGINRDNDNWDLYLPCGYTNIENELKNLPVVDKTKKIFGISGCDRIVSKLYLWKTLYHKFGNNYVYYFPRTYHFNRSGIKQLVDNHKPGMKYIAKKDVQRQTGLKIIHKLKDINSIINDNKFIVIQDLLNNPLLIDSRKINLRIYFLILCKGGITNAYIHSNGFVYYTNKNYDHNSLDKNAHITTGYIDRKIYQKNPLTIDDLYLYLDKKGHNSNNLKNNIVHLFKTIIDAIKIPICKNSNIAKGVSFQLFGCDIAPDNNLNVKLIEINKGPDLTAKDPRDDEVKKEVTYDLLEIVKVISTQNKKNRFIKIG